MMMKNNKKKKSNWKLLITKGLVNRLVSTIAQLMQTVEDLLSVQALLLIKAEKNDVKTAVS